VEDLRAIRPGSTEKEIMETVDDAEAMTAQSSSFDTFVEKTPLSIQE